MNEAAVVLQVLWTSLAGAAPLALFAVAFSLVLHVTKVWNFAQAGLMALALYALYGGYNLLHWPMWACLAFAFAATCAAGIAMELLALDVLRRRRSPHLTFFILTLMLSQFLAYCFALAFGTEAISVTPETMSPVRLVAGVAVSNWDLAAAGVAAAMLALLYAFVAGTPDGRAMVAVADNPELAELYGISARRARVVAFGASAALVTAGMALSGTHVALTAHSPMPLMLFAVIATLLGGAGKVFRAAAAALALALVQGLSIFVIPSRWQGLLLYAFLFVTILFFPRGFSWHPLQRRRGAPAAAARTEPSGA